LFGATGTILRCRATLVHKSSRISCRWSSVFVWGNGDAGQLGLGPIRKTEKFGNPLSGYYKEKEPVALTTVPLEDGETIVEFAGGADHSLAVTSNGKVFGWGGSKHGKLGTGDVAKEETVVHPKRIDGDLAGVQVVSVACGDSHSCAVDSEGRLYTWGWGGDWFHGGGLLGHGSNDKYSSPKLVESLVDEGVGVQAVTAGEMHTAILTTDGQVMTCGAGEFGRLGLGGSSDVREFTLLEWIEDENVVSLVSGHAFSMALTDEGRLWVWGRNDQGQLGQGGTMSLDVYSMQADPVVIDEFDEDRSIEIAVIAAGHSHAALCTTQGELYMWGMKNYLSPKKFDVVAEDGSNEVVVDIACGMNFTHLLTASGRTYTLGSNKSCLGLGDTATVPQPMLVSKLGELGAVDKIRAGQSHVAAFLK